MRVAFVTSHPIQYHAKWFKALADQPNLDLQVLYCHNPTPEEQGNAGFGVPFEWDLPLLDGYPYRFLRNVSSQPSIATFSGLDTPESQTLIRTGKYDAVVINGWHYKSAWQAIRACWRSGVPVLVRSDSHLRTPRPFLKTALKAAPYRWFISRLDGCLAVGRWSSDYFLHYGARADRIHIVPHVVDATFESESERLAACRLQLRGQWSLDPEQIVFLFAGKFIPEKRPLDYIEAVRCAIRQHPRVAGLMVGDGPLRAKCENIVQDGRLPIRFTGFLNQSEIVRAYVAADALVLPSEAETWGLVVNEAIACGKPVLVSDHVGCAPDLVRSGDTGFVFAVGDIHSLSLLMIDGARNPDQLVAMGKTARNILAQYSVPVAVDGLMRALRQTLANSS